jgi:Methyltransferase domain
MAAEGIPVEVDTTKAQAFASRLLTALNDAALCLMVSVGHRTGLFDVMTQSPPATSEELASRAGLNERYVREWLGAMVTARVVTIDPATSRFTRGQLVIPAARKGIQVSGLDLAANLVQQARARAAEDRLAIQIDEGDAENLPYPDASFDVVMSLIGAMFAPRPELVASEMIRVASADQVGESSWGTGRLKVTRFMYPFEYHITSLIETRRRAFTFATAMSVTVSLRTSGSLWR